jgi:Zinc carboxypeptidase
MLSRRLVLLVLPLVWAPLLAQRPSAIPAPRSVLGFDPGDDRKLAEWSTLIRYYEALARASDRVDYHVLGKSTLGAPFVALTISSAQNLRRLDSYRRINDRLADPRTIRSTRDALSALRDGRTMVLITGGIHSDEVGGNLTPAVLAYRLATDTSADTRAMLDNVILWLVPSLNPDGVDIVTKWYNRTLGTPAEGSDPPELYHHYVGHDNNRDWYAFTQVETQLVVDSIYSVWHPQIVLDLHQQGMYGSRMFLPPYLDPVEPNVDPLLVDGINALGTAVAWNLAGEGKTGISIEAIYDAWTPARAYAHYHGAVRILSEAASAQLATPVQIPFERLQPNARGFNPRLRSWNFTAPWPGGRWTLHDIVEYQTDAAYALLQHAARFRDQWLANFLSVGWHGVLGWRGWPYAYVIPRQQDTIAVATLLGILTRGGVEVRSARQAFSAGGHRYPSGTYVVVLRQPAAAFAKTLLEPQHYPDRRMYPGGPPERPYDVTAHTLPLLLGLTAQVVNDSLHVPLSGPLAPPHATPGYPGFDSTPPRIGLYRSYVPSMDEGWTRWVFDTWKVPYTSVVDSVTRNGKLKDRLDVLVLPDEPPQDIAEGLPQQRYPQPYPGGLGPDGIQSLRQFVTEGGTLVALNDASRFAIQALLLPVRNVLEGLPDQDFYAPGSIFRGEVDQSDPLAKGMPAETALWFESGPAFDVLDSTQVRVVVRYPDDPDDVLMSGWVRHPERVAGRAAMVDVRVGRGHVILFGFRPQYRGQSQATYPLFFNSLQLH